MHPIMRTAISAGGGFGHAMKVGAGMAAVGAATSMMLGGEVISGAKWGAAVGIGLHLASGRGAHRLGQVLTSKAATTAQSPARRFGARMGVLGSGYSKNTYAQRFALYGGAGLGSAVFGERKTRQRGFNGRRGNKL